MDGNGTGGHGHACETTVAIITTNVGKKLGGEDQILAFFRFLKTKIAKHRDHIPNAILPDPKNVVALNIQCDSLDSLKAREPACKDVLKKAKGKKERRK